MKKIFFLLVLVAMTFGWAQAQETADKPADTKGKTVIVRGILVDTSCYFEEDQKGDEHDGMDHCGKDCLDSGVPAGVLVGDKLYILIFPAPAFSNYVGKSVEIKGEAYGDNLIHPKKAMVIEKDGKKAIKLDGFEMM